MRSVRGLWSLGKTLFTFQAIAFVFSLTVMKRSFDDSCMAMFLISDVFLIAVFLREKTFFTPAFGLMFVGTAAPIFFGFIAAYDVSFYSICISGIFFIGTTAGVVYLAKEKHISEPFSTLFFLFFPFGIGVIIGEFYFRSQKI